MILLKVTLQQVSKIGFYDFVGLVCIVLSMVSWGAAFKSQPEEREQSPSLLHALDPAKRW